MKKMMFLLALISNVGCAGMQAQLRSMSNPDPEWIKLETGRMLKHKEGEILVHAETKRSRNWELSIGRCRLEVLKVLMKEMCSPYESMEGEKRTTSYECQFYGFRREASYEKEEVQHCLYSLPADPGAVEDMMEELMSLPPNS